MRVMLLVHGLPVGGTERVVVDLCRWLRGRKVQVLVACLDELGAFGEMLQADGVPTAQLHRQPGFDFGLPGRIAELAGRERIDVIHAHQYTPFFYGVMARYRTRCPLLFTEHGRFFPDLPSTKRRIFNRTVGRRVDGITAVSDGVKQALVAVERLPEERIEVLHNGLDVTGFALPDGARERLLAEWGVPVDAPVVGTVARLNSIKNQAMLIRAFARARRSVADAHLLMVGDGDERANLQQLAHSHQVGEAVHFTGEQTDVPHWLACMNVFALSSLSEGMPMTLLEAMAAGLPILTTDVGGINEMLHRDTEALMTDRDDEAGFAKALTRLLTDVDVRQRLGRSGRARLERDFSLDVIGERYLAIYRQMLDGGG